MSKCPGKRRAFAEEPLASVQVLHSGAKANDFSNSLCNIFPARPPFGSQFPLPALTKAWRPASVFAFLSQFCSSSGGGGGGSSSQSTAAASRRLWKEEEGTKERLLPGLRPRARTVLAPQAVFLPAKPSGVRRSSRVAQSSSSLRSFEPLPFYSSVLSFSSSLSVWSPPAKAQLRLCANNTRAAFAHCGRPGVSESRAARLRPIFIDNSGRG